MRLLDEVKGIFWLRRIALALEKQNEISEKFYELKERDWTQHNIKPKPREVEIGYMDPDEVAKDYLRRLEAERDGIELDD